MRTKILTKEVEGKVTMCNLCGRINVCDEDKIKHAELEHDGKIDVADNFMDKNKLYGQVGIQILAKKRGYLLIKPKY